MKKNSEEEQNKPHKKFDYRSIAYITFLLTLVSIFMFRQLCPTLTVVGDSMNDNFRNGDKVRAVITSNPKRNDVVIAKVDGESFIKRVIAVGGDDLYLREDGVVLVNNKKVEIKNSIVQPVEDKGVHYKVPKGNVFLLSDNRRNSIDSRIFGSVPESAIKYKVVGKK